MPVVNDIHSQLNRTDVESIIAPSSRDELIEAVARCSAAGLPMALSGARHAMGGQQFLGGQALLDIRQLSRVRAFDTDRGILTLEAGADWPTVIAATRAHVPASGLGWSIRQKQTGADDFTLAGSVSCNGHGRGLMLKPIVDDVESLTLLTINDRGQPDLRTCSREENAELFSLVCGGYGLFGVILDVSLRLAPRRKMRRVVDIIDIDDALNAVYRRAADGCLYGDFQYAIDSRDDSFLRRGVFACYKPVADDEPISDDGADLSRDAWLELLALAHSDKARAFRLYAEHYLRSHGRVYWSDTMQLGVYIPSYAEFLAAAGIASNETLMITELYVPPERLTDFMARSRQILRDTGVEDIYGTIRSIQKDDTSFLPWARENFACVIFNLRTRHDDAGIARTRTAALALIDAAADLGGSFYLTYHRWATRDQLLRSYPQFPEFLNLKRRYDPRDIFQSDWCRHWRSMLA